MYHRPYTLTVVRNVMEKQLKGTIYIGLYISSIKRVLLYWKYPTRFSRRAYMCPYTCIIFICLIGHAANNAFFRRAVFILLNMSSGLNVYNKSHSIGSTF